MGTYFDNNILGAGVPVEAHHIVPAGGLSQEAIDLFQGIGFDINAQENRVPLTRNADLAQATHTARHTNHVAEYSRMMDKVIKDFAANNPTEANYGDSLLNTPNYYGL